MVTLLLVVDRSIDVLVVLPWPLGLVAWIGSVLGVGRARGVFCGRYFVGRILCFHGSGQIQGGSPVFTPYPTSSYFGCFWWDSCLECAIACEGSNCCFVFLLHADQRFRTLDLRFGCFGWGPMSPRKRLAEKRRLCTVGIYCEHGSLVAWMRRVWGRSRVCSDCVCGFLFSRNGIAEPVLQQLWSGVGG